MKQVTLLFATIFIIQFSIGQKSPVTYDESGNTPRNSSIKSLPENQVKAILANAWTAAGPFGGDVMDIAMDPTNPDRGFAAAGYPYIRVGATEQWTVVQSLLQLSPSGIHCIEINSNGTMFAAGNYTYGKIFISTDGGDTWAQKTLGISAGILSITVDPTNPDIVYATTSGILGSTQSKVVVKSIDEGATWQLLDLTAAMPGGYGCVGLAIDPGAPATLFAIGSGGISEATIVSSTDGGETWQSAMGNLPASKPLNAVTIANGAVYVCGGQLFGGNVMGVYKSENYGTTWTSISNSFPNKVANDLLINPTDGNKMYVATEGDGVYYTNDGGANWVFNTGGAGDNGSARKVILHPEDDATIIAGYLSLGVCYSGDGGENWVSATEGISALELNDIEVDPNNAGILLASFEAENSGGCYMFSNNEWSLVESLPATRFSAVDIGYDGTLYAWSNGPTTVAAEGVYKSSDGGVTWDNMGPNLGSVFETQIWDIEVSAQDDNLLFIGGNNFGVAGWASMLYRSTDQGENWDNVFMGPENDAIRFVHMVQGANDMDVYAAYKSETGGGFLKSIDGGTNWLPINDGLPSAVKWCGAIVSDPNNSDVLYGGVGGYGGVPGTVYKSEDAGSSWNAMSITFGNYSKVTDFVIGTDNSMVIYAATTLDGVYMTWDGENWSAANDGLPASNITGFSRIADSGFDIQLFYASTATNSAFYTEVDYPTGTGINEKGISGISIFPNPAKEIISIRSEFIEVIQSIEIRDITGRLVFESSSLEKNSDLIVIKPELNSGSYIVSARSASNVWVSKLVIE